MNDLDHLPLPPDEPRPDQKVEPVRLAEVPLDWVQPIIPALPVAVPLSRETALVATVVPAHASVKKIRLRAVLITVLVAGLAALMSGGYGVYYSFTQSLHPLIHGHAKPVRHKLPIVPPIAAQKKATAKAHTRHNARRSDKKKTPPAGSPHKPWFSNSGQKGA